MWVVEPLDDVLKAALLAHLSAARSAYRTSRTPANAQALDEIQNFISTLCSFILLSQIPSPDPHLMKVYEPLVYTALGNYRVLSSSPGWCGFFRLDHIQRIIKPVYITRKGGVPIANLKDFLDKL